MPGFAVPSSTGRSLGSGESSTEHNPHYTYTWDVPQVFGDRFSVSHPAKYPKDVTLPSFSMGKEEVEGASLVYKYASAANWDDVRITFYDVAVNSVSLCDVLEKWRLRVWSSVGGVGMADGSKDISTAAEPDGYKAETQINYFTADLRLMRIWRLFGSWPQSIRAGDLTYTDSNVKLVEVVIVYDWAKCVISSGDTDVS